MLNENLLLLLEVEQSRTHKEVDTSTATGQTAVGSIDGKL